MYIIYISYICIYSFALSEYPNKFSSRKIITDRDKYTYSCFELS